MKKIISLIIVFAFVLCGASVFAEEEIYYGTVKPTELPETYIDSSIMLFGDFKTIEETLIEGWENFASEINIEDYYVFEEEIAEKYYGILNNNPILYYVSTGFRYSYMYNYEFDANIVVAVYPSYTYSDKTDVSKAIEGIKEATEEILLCLDENMTDFEKIMTVHDYMVLNYEYDYSYTNRDITIMTAKKGICTAYAAAFKYVMDQLGIDCLYVSSDEMNHLWNLVRVDGEWYHIDLTWDDAGLNFGRVGHEYALLSDEEIQNLKESHFGYNLKGLEASSKKYDKKAWHQGNGAIATIDKVYYYVENNNLVNQDGKIIYRNLNGDGVWDIGDGYYLPSGNYTGLAEHNGILYFNTDKAAYSYNPKNEEITKILDYDGICGLFIDKNTLEYCKLDRNNSKFVEAGKHTLGTIRFGGTFHKNGKIIKRIYKESDAKNINVFADCKDCIKVKQITDAGYSTITFDSKDCQTLYFWTDDLKPLKEEEIYN